MNEVYERIWRIVSSIPAGQVSTYGEVAERAGIPRGARLVGQALRHCPDQVPWHRVINARGRISLPAGSRAGRRQRDKLIAEGIEFVRGRVSLQEFGCRASLDELLWKPDQQWDE